MTLEFQAFAISRIGDLEPGGYGWVEVEIRFRDERSKAEPSIMLKVPVHYHRDWPVDRVRDAALRTAEKLLTATLDRIGHATVEELQQAQDDPSAAAD